MRERNDDCEDALHDASTAETFAIRRAIPIGRGLETKQGVGEGEITHKRG